MKGELQKMEKGFFDEVIERVFKPFGPSIPEVDMNSLKRKGKVTEEHKEEDGWKIDKISCQGRNFFYERKVYEKIQDKEELKRKLEASEEELRARLAEIEKRKRELE